jgi:putative nucleotidyltransferase with HDIG domain
MPFFDRSKPDDAQRSYLRASLFGLDLVAPARAAQIVEAWAVTWSHSDFTEFDDIPVSRDVATPLLAHVNQVAKLGIMLADASATLYGSRPDTDVLMSALLLHDVDKPMLFARSGGDVVASALSKHMPHGVLGALLLAKLGLPGIVVSTVATHATDAPFHGDHPLAMILHYADMFSIDSILSAAGHTPFYRRPNQLR